MNGDHDPNNFNLTMMQNNMAGNLQNLQNQGMSAQVQQNSHQNPHQNSHQTPISLQNQQNINAQTQFNMNMGMPFQFMNMGNISRHAQMISVNQSEDVGFPGFPQRFSSNFGNPGIQMINAQNQNPNINTNPNLGTAQLRNTNQNVVFVSNNPARQFNPTNPQNAFFMNNSGQMVQNQMNPMMNQMRMRGPIPQNINQMNIAQNLAGNIQNMNQMNQQMFQMSGMRSNNPNLNIQPQMIRQSPVFMIQQQMASAQNPYLQQYFTPTGLPTGLPTGINPGIPIDHGNDMVNFIQPFGGNISGGNLQPNISGPNLQTNLQQNISSNIQGNLQGNQNVWAQNQNLSQSPANIQQNIQGNLQNNISRETAQNISNVSNIQNMQNVSNIGSAQSYPVQFISQPVSSFSGPQIGSQMNQMGHISQIRQIGTAQNQHFQQQSGLQTANISSNISTQNAGNISAQNQNIHNITNLQHNIQQNIPGIIPTIISPHAQINQNISQHNIHGNIQNQNFERSNSQPQMSQMNQPNLTPQLISRPISDVSKPSIIHYKPQIAIDKSNLKNLKIDAIEQENEIEKAMIADNFLMPPSVPINSPPITVPAQDVDILSTPTTIRLCNSIPTCDSSPAMAIIENAIKNLKTDKQIISSIPDSTFVEILVQKTLKDTTFHHKQRFVIKESVFEQIYSRDHIEFQVKCVDNSNTINNWPKVFSLVINGKLVSGPIKDETTGDESILIKNFIQKDDNLLEVTCFVPGDPTIAENDDTKFAFKFLINLVLKSTMSVMCRALVHKRTQSVRKSIEFIQHFFVSNQIEMARGHTIVSFHDPVTRDRINLPVRGENCKHVQCFDFESFFSRHANRTHFVCPICGVVGAIPGIIVDGFICTLVNQFRNCDDVADVKITPECNWSLASSKSEESPAKSQRPPSEISNFPVDENFLSHEQLLNIFGDDKREALINFFNQANVKLPDNIQKSDGMKNSPLSNEQNLSVNGSVIGLKDGSKDGIKDDSKTSSNGSINSVSSNNNIQKPDVKIGNISKSPPKAASQPSSLDLDLEIRKMTKRTYEASESDPNSNINNDILKSDVFATPPKIPKFAPSDSSIFNPLFRDSDDKFKNNFNQADDIPDLFKFHHQNILSSDDPELSMDGLMRKSLLDKPDDGLPTTTWDPIDDDFLKDIDQRNTFDPGKL